MTSIETVGTVVLKFLKLAINIICLYLYRTGSDGSFLGVGGTWNLAENKNADAEIFASGVFIGYLIYTFVSLVALCFAAGDHKTTFTDILMNIVGVFLWIAVGATALHYWHGYLSEHKYTYVNSERQVGLALGSLCVLNGAVYLVDSVISVIFLLKAKFQPRINKGESSDVTYFVALGSSLLTPALFSYSVDVAKFPNKN